MRKRGPGKRGGGRGKHLWSMELARAEATEAAIRACVPPSPHRDAWLARTEAGVRLLRRYVRGLNASEAGR